MCGRYIVIEDEEYYEEIKNIVSEISERHNQSPAVSGEIFPTNTVPVIYRHNARSVLSTAKWGFPSFKGSGVIINARAESLAEKPMFREAFAFRRCILPANGYYEWLEKTKYLIKVREGRIFYMAGLYSMFRDKEGRPYPAITVITTSANPEISFIHDRMPVILGDGAAEKWLDTGCGDMAELQKLLLPYAQGQMEFSAA
jgi:putative SOS response-associated peptidase YedK